MEIYRSSDTVLRFNKDIWDLKLEMEKLEEGKGFSIPKSPDLFLSYEAIKKFTNAHSVGKRKYVVNEYETGYEVSRIADPSTPNLYYMSQKKEKFAQIVKEETSNNLDKLKNVCLEYKNKNYELACVYAKIDNSLWEDGWIPYGYLQRVTCTKPGFKKSILGATPELKRCIGLLVTEGFIEEAVDKKNAGKLYRIM